MGKGESPYLDITHHGKGKRQTAALSYRFDRGKLREAWRAEGRYLLILADESGRVFVVD